MAEKGKEIGADINGIRFLIKIVEPENEGLLVDNYYRAGATHKRTAEIYISNDLKDVIMQRVLLHEIVHAYIYTCGMGQVDWKEEVVADFIENNLENISWTWEKTAKALRYQKIKRLQSNNIN